MLGCLTGGRGGFVVLFENVEESLLDNCMINMCFKQL